MTCSKSSVVNSSFSCSLLIFVFEGHGLPEFSHPIFLSHSKMCLRTVSSLSIPVCCSHSNCLITTFILVFYCLLSDILTIANPLQRSNLSREQFAAVNGFVYSLAEAEEQHQCTLGLMSSDRPGEENSNGESGNLKNLELIATV